MTEQLRILLVEDMPADAELQVREAKRLRLLRCDEMQGYLFSKPLPLDELTALLEPNG